MDIKERIFILASITTCFLLQAQGADKYTDGNRPYEFGFTIDGEQHRHEKKDEKGLIQGEFGFITADGVYHVTVYATDEEGRFKILSMKNIRVKPYPSYTAKQTSTGQARQGHALELPSPSEASAQASVTTTTFKPISIEPPAKSCSHCSIPTTSTPAPIVPFNQPVSNNPNQIGKAGTPKFPGVKPQLAFVSESNGNNALPLQEVRNGSPQQTKARNYPIQPLERPQSPLEQELQPPQNSQSFPQEHVETPPASINGSQGSFTPPQNFASFPQQSLRPGQVPPSPKNNGSQINLPPTQDSQVLKQSNVPSQSTPGNSPHENQRGPTFNNQIQSSGSPKFPEQQSLVPEKSPDMSQSTVPGDNIGQNVLSSKNKPQAVNSAQYPGENAEPGPGNILSGRTPKRLESFRPVGTQPNSLQRNTPNNQGILSHPTKPTLISAQMQIVDKNTDIHRLSPGEHEGLPEGVTKDHMNQLLYTFNYTVGFHGHFEEGYTNGVKEGYYFVTGRNGIRTRVDYVADSKGFHPKISQEVLDLLSDDVPKPETEKEEKYGFKGYEFKWLYYPVEAKGR